MTARWLVAGAWGALVLGLPAHADGLASLEQFLRTVQSGRADFSQTVTTPPREGQPNRPRVSSGTFEFQRPDRFRFQYTRPFEQLIVADATTLWLFDVDLNQVTARPQARSLGSAPAALLAGAADLSALRRDYTLRAAPDAEGQSWVEAVPKSSEGSLRRVRIGFQQTAPATLEIEDALGQRTVLRFTGFQLNPVLAPERFRFTPPPGADVVRP